MQLRRESILLLLACIILWAGQSVAAKVATNQLPPFQVMAVRFIIPVICIGLIAVATGTSLRVRKKLIPSILLNGMFLCTQIALFTIGTSMTSSAHSVVLINSFPFFAAVACHLFLPGLTLKPRFLLGFFVAFAGLLIVMSDDLASFAGSDWRGDLLILLAAATMGAKIALVKSMLGRTSPIAMVFWECVTALPPVVVASLIFEPFDLSLYRDGKTLASLVYQGFAVSTLAFLAWTRLLKMHDPSQLLVYRLLTPVFGVLFGWLILSDRLTVTLLIGTAFVISGVYVVSRQQAQQFDHSQTITQI